MRIILAALGLAVATGSAMAADPLAPIPAEAEAGDDWTGFYIGGGLGVRHTTIDIDEPLTYSLSCATNLESPGTSGCSNFAVMDSVIHSLRGHLLAGYAYQHGPVVFAIEGDIEIGGDIKALPGFGEDPVDPINCADFDVCASSGIEVAINPLGHVRGIFGVVLHPNILGFVSGGVAVASASGSAVAISTAFGPVETVVDSTHALLIGPSLGVGVEVRATENLRIRVEGMVDHFGSFAWDNEATSTSVSGPDSAQAITETSGSASFTSTLARASLIWEF
jgi:opacity protein-like surface antigen